MAGNDRQTDATAGLRPAVRTFLRHAAAIIAAERGLSDSARDKLHALASRLNLTDKQFHQALENLQRGTDFSAPLSHWEKSYVHFLKKEFSKIRHGILTATAENRAVDLAARKYQISEVRAQQLIAQVIQSMSVDRIAPADAHQFSRRLIADRIGDQTDLEDEFCEALYREGRKWGLDSESVDEIIAHTLTENRRHRQGDRSVWRSGLSVLGVLVILVLVVWLGWDRGWWGRRKARPTPSPVIQPSILDDPHEDPNPVWWDSVLQQTVESLEGSDLEWAMELKSDRLQDPAERMTFYRHAIDRLLHGRGSDAIRKIVAQCYYADPDSSSIRVIDETIGRVFASVDRSVPLGRSQIQQGLAANRLLVALLADPAATVSGRPQSEQRRQQIRRLIEQWLGVDRSGPVPKRTELDRQYLLALWNKLIADAFATPTAAASVIGPLYEQSRQVLDTGETYSLGRRAIAGILESDASRWTQMRPTIERLVDVAGSRQQIDWIDCYLSTEEPTLRRFLGAILVQRAGVQPESNRIEDITAALRGFRLQSRQQKLSRWIARNAQCRSQIQRIENLLTRQTEPTPQHLAYAIHGTNLSLAWLSDLASGGDDWRAPFEPGLPSLADFPPDALATGRGDRPTPPTPAEKRQLNEALMRLAELPDERSASRITAWRELVEIAGRFEEIDAQAASVLADYLLKKKSAAEELAVEQRLGQVAHWPRLALALADRLPDSEASLDTCLTWLRRMGGEAFDLSRTEAWRESLVRHWKRLAWRRIRLRNQTGTSLGAGDWNRLERYCRTGWAYRSGWLAAFIGSTNSAAGVTTASGGNVRHDLLDWLRIQIPNGSSADRWTHVVEVAQSTPSLPQSVLIDQLLVEHLERKCEVERVSRPRVNEIMQVYRQQMEASRTSGERLFWAEVTLMRLANALREKTMSRALED